MSGFQLPHMQFPIIVRKTIETHFSRSFAWYLLLRNQFAESPMSNISETDNRPHSSWILVRLYILKVPVEKNVQWNSKKKKNLCNYKSSEWKFYSILFGISKMYSYIHIVKSTGLNHKEITYIHMKYRRFILRYYSLAVFWNRQIQVFYLFFKRTY